MKKSALFILAILFITLSSLRATIHEIKVWNGYFQFIPNSLTIQLGDTINWVPFDAPSMTHTITSTNIPNGAATFDQIWKLPADTFFQYVPQYPGTYNYVCTPHEVNYGMVGSFTVQSTTSLNEETKESQKIKLYPIPTSNLLNISNYPAPLSYKVLNINGKKVLEGNSPNVSVSSLPNGIYFLQLINSKNKLHKFIVSDKK